MKARPDKTIQFLSLPKAADTLGLDVRRVRDAVARGQLRAVKFGEHWMVPRAEIARLIEAE